jgi:hypothetical protein
MLGMNATLFVAVDWKERLQAHLHRLGIYCMPSQRFKLLEGPGVAGELAAIGPWQLPIMEASGLKFGISCPFAVQSTLQYPYSYRHYVTSSTSATSVAGELRWPALGTDNSARNKAKRVELLRHPGNGSKAKGQASREAYGSSIPRRSPLLQSLLDLAILEIKTTDASHLFLVHEVSLLLWTIKEGAEDKATGLSSLHFPSHLLVFSM